MRALSLILASLAFALSVPLTFVFMDEICFWTISPYYFAKVARLQPDRDGVRRATFPWRVGFFWSATLRYDESDSIAELGGSVDGLGKHSIWRMHGHFYVDYAR
jgi:hypothetical protein